MIYDETTDTYTCANGKKLSVKEIIIRKTTTNYLREVTVYESEDCKDCPLRSACTKAKEENNKKIEVSKKMLMLREESLQNITSEMGAKLRTNRSTQVEGAFGVLKEDYGFRKFLTRGISKISVEFLLLSFAYNVKKLHSKIQNDCLGCQLYQDKKKKAA